MLNVPMWHLSPQQTYLVSLIWTNCNPRVSQSKPRKLFYAYNYYNIVWAIPGNYWFPDQSESALSRTQVSKDDIISSSCPMGYSHSLKTMTLQSSDNRSSFFIFIFTDYTTIQNYLNNCLFPLIMGFSQNYLHWILIPVGIVLGKNRQANKQTDLDVLGLS